MNDIPAKRKKTHAVPRMFGYIKYGHTRVRVKIHKYITNKTNPRPASVVVSAA